MKRFILPLVLGTALLTVNAWEHWNRNSNNAFGIGSTVFAQVAPYTSDLLVAPDEDLVGMFSEAPDGVKDVHIQLTGVSGAIIGVRITGAGAGEWVSPFNGYNWIVAIRPQSDPTIVDLYFDFYQPNTTYYLTLTFSDGTTQTLQTLSIPALGPQPVTATPLWKGTLFAAPDGSGVNCNSAAPCSLATVTEKAIPGDVVFLRGGIYDITSSVYFEGVGNSTNPITFESYPNETAIFDGGTVATGGNVWVRITGDWNVLRRIEIRNMPQDGLFISGTYNVVDGLNAHHNRMTGIHIYSDYAAYPYGAQGSYNTIQNSTANDNSDVGQAANGGNADGIAISSGEANKVLYCLAARNSDDGIDTWRSTNTEIAYSIATANGLASGNGNGIKAGSGTQPPYSNDTYVHHSLSYKNRANGIDANGGTNVKFSYNTSWANGAYGFVLSNGSTVDHGISLGNNGHVIGSGTATDNSWQRQGTVTFVSTDPASVDFMRPTAGGGFEDIGAIVP